MSQTGIDTRIAIALKYREDIDPAPQIAATGRSHAAKKIIEIAKRHNIPIQKDEHLANILSLLDINDFIPLEAYETVAKILAHIHQEDL